MQTHMLHGSRAAVQAQLILASLFLCLLPITLLFRPPQTHAVKIDLPSWPDWAAAASARPTGLFMSTMIFLGPPSAPRDFPSTDVAPPDAAMLELTRDSRILFEGAEVDFLSLRTHLEHAAATGRWIDFRPHAWARYELFLEVLAVTRWAGIERLHLAHGAFAGAING